MLRVHVSACTFTAFGLHSHVYMFTTVVFWALLGTFAAQPSTLYAAHVTLRTCPCAYAWVWSLNLLLLCSVKCIYMKRRLTFPFRLKPWRPDILLTVAADILPLFPQEDYITPLLSPLISLSNILFLPPLLCSTPLLPFNISPSFSCRHDCAKEEKEYEDTETGTKAHEDHVRPTRFGERRDVQSKAVTERQQSFTADVEHLMLSVCSLKPKKDSRQSVEQKKKKKMDLWTQVLLKCSSLCSRSSLAWH